MLLFTFLLLAPCARSLPSLDLASLPAALASPSSPSSPPPPPPADTPPSLLPPADLPSNPQSQFSFTDTNVHSGGRPKRRHRLRKRTSSSTADCSLTPRDPSHQPPSDPSSNPGIIQAPTTAACGPPSASAHTTVSTGPNGAEEWLNCGLTSEAGWNPPYVSVGMLVTVNLTAAMSAVGTPFGACEAFVGSFEKWGEKYSIPPIILASIALQESSCNPSAIGAGGTAGLMQISQDKCAGAPQGNCLDPDFNIGAGAGYLAGTIEQEGGNFLKALGYYNGWYIGMTASAVELVGQGSCCGCMQNLDYLMQSLNGWFVGKDAYALGLGTFQNLQVCQK